MLLLDAGADVNIAAEDGTTALMFAAGWNHCQCLNVLLESGADVNAKNELRDTALILAAEAGNSKCMKMLIKAGADVNFKGQDFYTSLMFAAMRSHHKCVELLVNAGANVNAREVVISMCERVELQRNDRIALYLGNVGNQGQQKLSKSNSDVYNASCQDVEMVDPDEGNGDISETRSEPEAGVNMEDVNDDATSDPGADVSFEDVNDDIASDPGADVNMLDIVELGSNDTVLETGIFLPVDTPLFAAMKDESTQLTAIFITRGSPREYHCPHGCKRVDALSQTQEAAQPGFSPDTSRGGGNGFH